jgi:lysozyme family protein
MGITPREWAKFKGVSVSTLTPADMKGITEAEAYAFYEDRFVAFGVDKFPPEVQEQIFDMTTQHGGWKTIVRNAEKKGPLTNESLVEARKDYIEGVVKRDPQLRKLLPGMLKRAEKYLPVPTAPVPKARPSGTEELPESQIMDTVTQTVPDATPKEVKEVIDHLQGANTLDAIRALGARQRAIMSAILNAYNEEEQQQPEQPAASSTVGSGPYRQPTPTPFVLGE